MGRGVALALLVAALAGCGGDDPDEAGMSQDTSSGASPCPEVEKPDARSDGGEQAPTEALSAGSTYIATVSTNCGTFEIHLDQKASPKATASFAALARSGYFDQTIFHRIVPGFVIQGGDPTQTGMGGPGYTTVDPPASGTTYTEGTVAMAKGATDPAGMSGSQFFVVTAPDAGLPPDYAVIGHVTSGGDVVQRIGKLGDASERPTQTVVVESITIDER